MCAVGRRWRRLRNFLPDAADVPKSRVVTRMMLHSGLHVYLCATQSPDVWSRWVGVRINR